MFALKYNGNFLNLSPGAKADLEFNSPIDMGDNTYGNISFSFNLSNDEWNQVKLGYPNIISNRDRASQSLDGAEIYFGGVSLYTGKLKIKSVGSSITVSLEFIQGSFSTVKKKKLSELDLGGERNFATTLQAWMLDTLSGNADTHDFVFAPLKNEGLTAGNTTGVINAYDPDADEFAGASDEPSFSLSPWVYVKYVVKQICNESGISLVSKFFEDDEIRKLVFYNASVKTYEQANHPTANYRPFWLKYHLPDITVSDFLNELKKYFCLHIDINKRTGNLEIEPFKDLINADTSKDWTDKVVVTGQVLDYDDMKTSGFNFQQSADSGDSYNGNTPSLMPDLSLIVGDGGNDMRTAISYPAVTDYTTTGIGSGSKDWETPIVNQATTEEISPDPTLYGSFYKISSFTPRFMFYRGMRNVTTGGKLYPTLGVDEELRPLGSGALKYNLQWEGRKGLYDVFWEEWTKAQMSGRRLSTKVKLDIIDLLNLNTKHLIRIKSNYFLIRRVRVSLGKTIGLADVDLIQVD